MRILVCGDRNWTDQRTIWIVLDGYYAWTNDSAERLKIIEGQCPYGGADKHAEDWCKRMAPDVEHLPFPAAWDVLGRAAGPARNQRMLDEGRPDLVLAFHDNLVRSRGTANMIALAKRAGVPVLHISHL
jgi:hypothetical protein